MNLAYNFRKGRVISLNIDLISYENALERVVEEAKCRRQGYVCFANVHMTIESYEDKYFADQVNNASLVLSDGVPLVKVLKYFYGQLQDRIAGMDIFPDLIRLSDVNSLKVFFFGTTPEILAGIRIRMEREFPNVKIVGLFSPPFDKSLDDDSYIKIINDSNANLVFVALGCPKQEKWMATHSHKINSVLLGVGGAFPVFSGVTKRAPKLLQNLGLEWLYRLAQEPRRLFGRYLRTNTKFIFLVAKEKIRMFFH